MQAKGSNFTNGGWAPYGVRGVWNGASLVFFSYIGFDAIATTAEEVLSGPLIRYLSQRTSHEAHEVATSNL